MNYTKKCKLWKLGPGGYHLVIQARLHGEPVHLLIDTGANHTCFDKQFVDSLDIDTKESGKDEVNVGIGGEDFVALIAVMRDLKIGRRKIPPLHCRLIDLQHVNATYQMAGFPNIQGIIGGDFLKSYHAVIDYGQRTLTFDI